MGKTIKKKTNSEYPSVVKFLFKKKAFIEKKLEAQLKKNETEIGKNATATSTPNLSPIYSETEMGLSSNETATLTPNLSAMNSETGSGKTNTNETAVTLNSTEIEQLELKKKYKIVEHNLKIAKSLLKKSSQLNLEKDLKIKQIMSQHENSNGNLQSDDILFETFSNHFDTRDMHEIRSVGPGSKKDSTFISKIMQSFYKNDLDKLNHRSATGKKFKGTKKHEITFEKKEVMEKMLIERLKCELKDELCASKEFLTRVGRLNTLLRFAIGNLLPKKRKIKI